VISLAVMLPRLTLFAACLSVVILMQAQNPVGGAVIPSLKGVVFVSSKDGLKAAGISTPGIQTSDVKMLDSDDFRASLETRLNHPLTIEGLNDIAHSVVTYYRSHNHPLVDATVPAQNVETGVVQVVVTEFYVGSVRAQGNKWFSDSVVTAPLAFQHGDAVDSANLLNQLDAANTNPFRRVNLVYEPSKEAGYTDLVLETQDRFPIRVFTGFDNGGTPSTGRNRWETGVTWGNAFRHDQQLAYDFSASTDLFGGGSSRSGQPGGPSFAGHSLTWSVPVFGRDSISILGGFQRSVPNLGQDFGLVGIAGQAGFRYSHAFRRTGSFIHTLQVGYDFKTTNNNLDFGGNRGIKDQRGDRSVSGDVRGKSH
jgi:hemolysin activation/secretion protein